MRRLVTAVAALVAVALATAAPAAASPVATSDSEYAALGAVFPDPHGGPCAGTCSPTARGNVRAISFVQWIEFIEALKYMNTSEEHPDWKRYMEILPLDGKLDDPAGGTQTAGSAPGEEMAPGNNLPFLEFKPEPEYVSAGLPTTEGNVTQARRKSDLVVVRVTDENVPDAGKKRYALSLSIHGIERAGAEGGIRAIADLVTAHTPGTGTEGGDTLKADEPVVPEAVKPGAPTFRDVLQKTIIYFAFPNPDGWRRGSVTSQDLGVFFQRYNGNGVDLNRDWPGIGYAFRGYSALSEPETYALAQFFLETRKNGGPFTLGDDLHGQPGADALSYTLLPQGRRDLAKDRRIRDAAQRINRGTFEAIKWHPLVQDNDNPPGTCSPAPIYSYCAPIYAQTWGTVYDTINYTTSGTLGDWFDQAVGLNAEGIDNEMSYSHLDKNIVFDNSDSLSTEQLHVDGNTSLIYARVTEMLQPGPAATFDAPGRKGYVPNLRLKREQTEVQALAPANTVPQPQAKGRVTAATPFAFPVQRTEPQGEEPGIYNGGMRISVRPTNVGGLGPGVATLQAQCRFCDEHPGTEEPQNENDWVTVTQDFNQAPTYANSGLVVTVNRPQALNRNGKPVEWRAVVNAAAGIADAEVDFFSRPASGSGEFPDPDVVDPKGGVAPVLNGYDIANTDFFRDLNPFVPSERQRFAEIDPRRVINGRQSLDSLASLALADDPLPGYTGPYGKVVKKGPPTAELEIARDVTQDAAPGGYGLAVEARPPGTYTQVDFELKPEEGNKSMRIRIDWEAAEDDWDMYLYRVVDGEETQVASSTGAQLETNFEDLTVTDPEPGTYRLYVDNFAASPASSWAGKITFEPLPPDTGGAPDTGAFTIAEKDAWIGKLRQFAEGGGNLVLTDGAVRALADLLPQIPREAIRQGDVYAGQIAFGLDDDTSTKEDPLATTPQNIQLLGSRDNGQRRRQTFEPTPLGFFVDPGRSQVGARQWMVKREQVEKAGGRVAGTGASAAVSAEALYDEATLGEIKMGKGQVRFIGALLPQPQTKLDHEYGLEPYAVTYTGYILARNLFEAPDRPDGGGGNDNPPGGDRPPGGNNPPGGDDPFAQCRQSGGISSAAVRRSGRGVRIDFERRTKKPVDVDVFRVSQGRRVVRERLVARFRNREESFTWNGVSNREGKPKRVGSGYYFVRYTMRDGNRKLDVRRLVLRRANGRFTPRPDYFRRDRCDLLYKFKLARPVFGGPRKVSLKGAYQLAAPGRVTVTILKGSKVVRRYRTQAREPRRTYRFTLPAAKRARGDYRVRLEAEGIGMRVTSVMTSRRL